MTEEVHEIRVGEKGKLSTLSFTSTELSIARAGKKPTIIPVRQVLWAESDTASPKVIHISVLGRKKKSPKNPLSLIHLSGEIQSGEETKAKEWADALMHLAYEALGIKRKRSLRVLVNPHGGKGKAVAIYNKKVAPIFAAAQSTVDLTHTTHAKHAVSLAQSLPLDTFDALVAVSGDGLLHECINGLATHSVSPARALKIPLAPIPTGSGNGTSLNLLGIDQGFDVCAAALNVLKGRPMPMDLFSITQDGKRSFSYMTQCVGLMAELDLGTENLRWMGDTRFIVGFLRGLLSMKPTPVTLSMKVVVQDKNEMVSALQSARAHPTTYGDASAPAAIGSDDAPARDANEVLPPLQYTTDEEGWTTFDKPLLFVYAGQAPYVGRDLMQFPVALPNDGLIDIAAQELTNRSDMLSAMDGAEMGETFWLKSQHYFKAHAYRISPTPGSKGYVSIDGEAYEWKPFAVEVHPSLATFLSPDGRFAAEFTKSDTSKK
ncbi:hypothetical protein PUNSTDRAFT_144839 [Punctularia strigosozonata HHB-11173 SS5]|uniref:uncharacterized protein n=1 Tax=Punctularia strigosozonata (strain HHB-11173) TaxID=741275 RepID=UPI0004417424|nr:uncharacterized protein PUNSTDRAFT_144839 [Punctularia strigosozonata HHB-11173 SS5]EIN07333.1 hypothetical protein PUNSTDRAFT_144839 [Punctularia strigosozonata HHB-11173 SS5]